MTEFKDIFFQDIEGTIPATKDGDKVALALNNPPSFLHEQSVHDGSDYDYILVGNGIKIPIGSRNIDGMNAALNTDHINK